MNPSDLQNPDITSENHNQSPVAPSELPKEEEELLKSDKCILTINNIRADSNYSSCKFDLSINGVITKDVSVVGIPSRENSIAKANGHVLGKLQGQELRMFLYKYNSTIKIMLTVGDITKETNVYDDNGQIIGMYFGAKPTLSSDFSKSTLITAYKLVTLTILNNKPTNRLNTTFSAQMKPVVKK